MQHPEENALFTALVVFAVLFGIGTILLRATSRDVETARFEVRLLLIGMLVRFGMSLILYVSGLIEVILDEDGYGWWGGDQLYLEWVRRGLSLLDLPAEFWTAFENPLGNSGYYYLVGAMFFLFDVHSRLPAAVLNNFFGALTAVLAYRIAGLLFSQWVARRVAWWSCLMPSLVIWAAQTVKEPVVIFLETGALYCAILVKAGRASLIHVIACALFVFLLVAFRFYAAYFTGAAVVLSLLVPALSRGRSTMGAGLAVGVGLFLLLVTSGLVARHQPVLQTYSLAQLQMIRDYTARNTGSGVVLDYDLQTTSGFLMSALIGWAHLLLAPFPWQLGGASLRMLLTVPDVVVWWWLFFFCVLPGLRLSLRTRLFEILPILFFLAGLGTLYSIIFSNVGLAYRYRAQLLPWLLIFAMVGLEQRKLRQLALKRVLGERWRRRTRPRMSEALPASPGSA
jgi:hypothetical protein